MNRTPLIESTLIESTLIESTRKLTMLAGHARRYLNWLLAGLLLALSLALGAGSVSAQDLKEVIAKGEFGIHGDQATAKAIAKQNALRNALEQGAGLFLDSETLQENYRLLNDRIFSATSGFVESYEVISEGVSGSNSNLYVVEVRALVKAEQIKAALNSIEGLRVLQEQRGDLTMIVIYDPETEEGSIPLKFSKSNERAVIMEVISGLEKEFLAKQFIMFDKKTLEEANRRFDSTSQMANFDTIALKLANEYRAKLLTKVRIINILRTDGNLGYVNSRIQAESVLVSTGQLLGTETKEKKESYLKSAQDGALLYRAMAESGRAAAALVGASLAEQILLTLPKTEIFTFTFVNVNKRQQFGIKEMMPKLNGYRSHDPIVERNDRIQLNVVLKMGSLNDASVAVNKLLRDHEELKGMFFVSECSANRCTFSPDLN